MCNDIIRKGLRETVIVLGHKSQGFKLQPQLRLRPRFTLRPGGYNVEV